MTDPPTASLWLTTTVIDVRVLSAQAALVCLATAFLPVATADDGSAREPSHGSETGVRPAARTVGHQVAPPAPSLPTFASVTVRRPDVRVRSVDGLGAADVVRGVDGVADATAIRTGRIVLGGDEGGPALTVAAVDPLGFRPLAPQVTADAVALWERLVEGEAVVTHATADTHGLELGREVALGGATAVTLRVGAFATNGTPPVADVLVSREAGRRLGLDAVAPTVLVAVDDGASPADVADRIGAQLGAETEVIPDPRVPAESTAPPPAPGVSVWDRLAACESSGNWHIDTGNGFYGGLQFLPESWRMVGGEGMPHEAPREIQIAMAERLLAIQGWRAWPVCSVKLGLREPNPNDPLDVSLGLA